MPTITQLYTAVPGDLVTAARWNNEFGNIYDNAVFGATSGDIIATGTTTARSLPARFSERINAKDFGATGLGIADDSTAIQAGLDYVAAHGKTLYFPSGDYNIQAGINLASAAYPFAICGDGKFQSTWVRGGSMGSLLNISESVQWSIYDIGFNASFAEYPTSANHGITFFNCSYVTIKDVYVKNWKNTAILGYASPSAGISTYIHNRLDNCIVDGLDNANNGLLFSDQTDSGFLNCKSINIGKAGSPCYALQFKESCVRCYMIGGYASGAVFGVACGNTGAGGDDARDGIVRGVHIYNCRTGIGLGNTRGYVIDDCLVDNNDDVDSLYAIDFGGDSKGNTVRNLHTRNMLSNKPVALFRAGDIDNNVHIGSMDNRISGVVNTGATFSVDAFRNTVILEKVVDPITVSSVTTLVSNLSDSTNVFFYNDLPMRQLATLATGAVAIRDKRVEHIRIDTEAAAATDDCDTISGGTDGQVIRIDSANSGRDVTYKHNTGNLLLNGAVDFTLTNTADTLSLVYKSSNAKWCEIGRGDNA